MPAGRTGLLSWFAEQGRRPLTYRGEGIHEWETREADGTKVAEVAEVVEVDGDGTTGAAGEDIDVSEIPEPGSA